ncbi:MAG: class I SAM-dependent methyltransferase [Candidatus Dadabacteria bacterium]|nr:class I SAM-dependent methyltransferase [Candidatus Dadabacteria bacterium]
MSIKIPTTEKRTFQQLKEHYEIEKELASRLRNACKEDRKHLYASLYDELFKRVPHHPQLRRKGDSKDSHERVALQMRFLNNFLSPETIFLEVGSGDCGLALEVAQRVRKVYAVDVSKEITRNLKFPPNIELIFSDGCGIPIPENSITIVYSDQLIEHLHPDDAVEQIQNIYKALTIGGVCICITPNRLSGPHDISKYFDKVVTGFHLKEYTNTELIKLFRKVGFSKIYIYANSRRVSNLFTIKLYEKLLGIVPHSLRKRIISWLAFDALLYIVIVGKK